MSSFVISLSLYLLSANVVAGAFYVFGRKKAGLLWVEYPFIYTPWIVLQLLTPAFEEIPALAGMDISFKYFLFMLQGFSCGVMGGMILLPRFFVKADTVWEKLRVTMISSLLMGILYLITRYLLLEAFRFLLAAEG